MLWECVRLPKPDECHHGRESTGRRQTVHGTNSKGVPLSVPLPGDDYGPNLAAEDEDVLFFHANIPGPSNLHQRWYLRRRRRPMVPAPSSTPLPENEKDDEGKARLYLVYMRPWTLVPEWSSPQVPLLQDLDVLPRAALRPPRKRLRQKSSVNAAPHRSFQGRGGLGGRHALPGLGNTEYYPWQPSSGGRPCIAGGAPRSTY